MPLDEFTKKMLKSSICCTCPECAAKRRNAISEQTLKMIDSAAENFKKGKTSDIIALPQQKQFDNFEPLAKIEERKEQNIMKNTPETLTLATAVLLLIDILRIEKSDFSAYDITQNIRTAVNNGSLVVSDLPTFKLGGKETNFVGNREVKKFLDEIFGLNLIPNYSYKTRQSDGDKSYMLYMFEEAPTNAGSYSYTDSPVELSSESLSDWEPEPRTFDCVQVSDLIRKYIENKINKNQYIHIKQIQSRLKGVKIVTGEIIEIVRELGYVVDYNPERPCKSFVYES